MELHSLENRVLGFGRGTAGALVVKLYRPGSWDRFAIEEEHAFASELRRGGVAVAQPLALASGSTIGRCDGVWYAAFDWIEGDDRTNQTLDAAEIVGLGRLAGELHRVGQVRLARHRRSLRPGDQCRGGASFLIEGNRVPSALADELGRQSRAILGALEVTAHEPVLRLHGDLGLWNMRWRGRHGPTLIDFDDFGNGPVAQDLALLVLGIAGVAGGDRPGTAAARGQVADLLARGYRQVRPLEPAWQTTLGPVLAARRIHVLAWIASRWSEPSFREKYPDFTSAPRWERELAEVRRYLAPET